MKLAETSKGNEMAKAKHTEVRVYPGQKWENKDGNQVEVMTIFNTVGPFGAQTDVLLEWYEGHDEVREHVSLAELDLRYREGLIKPLEGI